ncbi:hypothetical protein FH972_012870 [Carpinus fangiana]|uniref:Uncharacterized protein n=1 Tax=Carpinus fangiana TaxID=176857 RepID=A0A5N6R540_9ROSI|nr:hypothetical protein FH972_012870 [Carpinus fangiana]
MGRRVGGAVIIPEGEGNGWTDCREQFSKLKHFHDKQKLGGSLPKGHPGKVLAGPVGLNKGKMIISSDHTSLLVVQKSYAEAIQGIDHTLSLNLQPIAGKCKVGKSVLEKFNGRNPLVDILSVELEEKEKAVIMTREEQVRILTVRDLLSDFKKDLLKCLESYLVGWTPPSDAVNQDINFYGAVRILEKGEKSWAGPSPASLVCLAIPANGLSESLDATTSGSQLPAELLQDCLSPEIAPSILACPFEELQSMCGLGSPAFRLNANVAASGLSFPAKVTQVRTTLEDVRQSLPARGPVFWHPARRPILQGRISLEDARQSQPTRGPVLRNPIRPF